MEGQLSNFPDQSSKLKFACVSANLVADFSIFQVAKIQGLQKLVCGGDGGGVFYASWWGEGRYVEGRVLEQEKE